MGPLHPYGVPLARPRVERTESKAVISLVLGLLSMGCVGPIAGIPAIILGSIARRDIDRSSGHLGGRGIAAAGIVSGLFGTGLGVVLVLWVVGAAFVPETPEPTDSRATISRPAPPPPGLTAPTEEPPRAVVASPPAIPSGTRSYGTLEVVDLDQSRPLRAQLAEIVTRSRGRTVIVQTYVSSSPACAAVDAALPDKRMQRALANVTLVRVDVDEYESELHKLHLETTTAPWFYKLDATGTPTDALSADAWEASAPENMAAVLRKFVHPTSPKTRPSSPAPHHYDGPRRR